LSRVGPRDPGVIGLRPRRSLSDLLWVANTRHGPAGHWFARVGDDVGDHDHLTSAPMAVKYLSDHRVSLPAEDVTPRQLRSLDEIRQMVRGLLDPAVGWTLAARAILDQTRFHVDVEGRLAPEGSGWDAFIGDLMVPLIQVVELRHRLRICGNPHCRLMFLDLSKNQARLWCDNAGCGNRDRVRRYRSRAKVDHRVSP
jgi:CGNR zinc finger